jgi:acetyl esterase/lipase
MAARWLAAGNDAALDVYPGGCHVFVAFPGPREVQGEAFYREIGRGGQGELVDLYVKIRPFSTRSRRQKSGE